MATGVVITGIGLVTPLGRSAGEVLDRIGRGQSAASPPPFEAEAFDCPLCARVDDFDAQSYFPENKTLRLMNRDAQMAAVAARLAMQDAAITVDRTYPADSIALYGSTGLAGMPIDDLVRLIRYTAAPDGSMDLGRFGQVALKRVRPVLSFKILANMPICFVSIFENLRGPNAVYTPWEGQGAQAIAAGVRAVRRGDVPAAVVGGCDVRTRILSFVSMQQLGVFESWARHAKGLVPAEGAAFLVLEDRQRAVDRRARIYATIRGCRIRSANGNSTLSDTFSALITALELGPNPTVVAAGDQDVCISESERQAFSTAGLRPQTVLYPKAHLGNLFAASAAAQVGLAAALAARRETAQPVLADCFGFGTEQAAFVLEAV